MAGSPATRDKLEDLVELQPTTNGELADRWGADGGSEVHRILEDELGEYYYRDEDSLICATPAAIEAVEGESGGGHTVTVPDLQAAVLEVLAGPEAESQSVVSVLQSLRDLDRDPDVAAVRSALRSLADKGVVETVDRTVPTFRLAVTRSDLTVETA